VESDDLRSTVETLKTELISSNDEAERASRELEALRTRAIHESAQESMVREREFRETQSELEKCRIERDEWERALLQERVLLNEAQVSIDVLTRDLEMELEARRGDVGALGMERERANNLQSVLEDFQAGRLFPSWNISLSDVHTAKDHEVRQAVSDLEIRYNEVTVSLAEFKHRALTAEVRISNIDGLCPR
jgi:outer membrane murein-binding lipoprotein Lpp